jgi:two-component system copper resistance phosphate regulon response regulator CusR
MRILLVDDDQGNTVCLRQGLLESGFAVDIASSGHAGLDLACTANYDLLVLDGLSGVPFLTELRRSGKETPVLFWSGQPLQGTSETSGDCIPAFDLLTGIHSALRRNSVQNADRLRIDDLEIDLVRHRVSRAGHRIDLTYKEFLLLSLLSRRAGEVLSRPYIADQIWGINFDSNTNFVDVHIRRLRGKVDDPFEKKLIHTVRGRGYVIEDR